MRLLGNSGLRGSSAVLPGVLAWVLFGRRRRDGPGTLPGRVPTTPLRHRPRANPDVLPEGNRARRAKDRRQPVTVKPTVGRAVCRVHLMSSAIDGDGVRSRDGVGQTATGKEEP